MAAPAAANPLPTLTSGAADSTYNETIASIEHGEGNLFGNTYGTTGEISPGSELGQAITGTRAGLTEQLGPNFATKGELGGSLGLSQGMRTRALSARAGANTQSGLYGTERGNVLQGFAQRATGIERRGTERIKGIEDRARKAWEKDQADRAAAVRNANTRYLNYVQRNPGPAVAPPGVTAAGGGPPGSRVTVGPGSPGQPIQAGFGNLGGPTPVGGFGTPGNFGVIQVGGVRAGRPTFGPPPRKTRR